MIYSINEDWSIDYLNLFRYLVYDWSFDFKFEVIDLTVVKSQINANKCSVSKSSIMENNIKKFQTTKNNNK